VITVAALYRFARFEDPESLRAPLLKACRDNGIKGTLLLAGEGINGTIAGSAAGIEIVVSMIRSLPDCEQLDVKYSNAEQMPFHRMKVRIKKEIVTLGVPGIDPSRNAGVHVDPLEWNRLVADPDTILIDTRNNYEVAIGTFRGAIDPRTKHFSEFPQWFREHRDELGAAPKVAMFCTGGIRCEKSTAFLRAEGIENVFHLKGGILRYLEAVPPEESLWEGECFVFDERVSVGHGLAVGTHALCRACRRPLSEADRSSAEFVEGIQCPSCAAERTASDRQRYAERHRQVKLAERKGRRHVGDVEG
jgi:UPF0176 protein